jgi:hypothetical protein
MKYLQMRRKNSVRKENGKHPLIRRRCPTEIMERPPTYSPAPTNRKSNDRGMLLRSSNFQLSISSVLKEMKEDPPSLNKTPQGGVHSSSKASPRQSNSASAADSGTEDNRSSSQTYYSMAPQDSAVPTDNQSHSNSKYAVQLPTRKPGSEDSNKNEEPQENGNVTPTAALPMLFITDSSNSDTMASMRESAVKEAASWKCNITLCTCRCHTFR